MDGNECWNAARGGDLTAVCERLPALCAGPLDRRMAEAPREGRGDRRPLRRRLRDRISRGIRRPALSGGFEGADGQVWLGPASGEDASDRVWALRGRTACATRRRPSRDVRLSGFHAHQRENPARRLHDPPQDGTEEIPGQVERPEREVEAEPARGLAAGGLLAAKR